MSNPIDIEKIKAILPHRYPFLLVDRVQDYKKGSTIKAIKNVTVNEPFFQGHFPQKLIMPGVLIIEALAQTAALLAHFSFEEKLHDGTLYYLAGVDNARFRKPVVPGDQLLLEVALITFKRNVCKFEASARVRDDLIASAELLTTVMS